MKRMFVSLALATTIVGGQIAFGSMQDDDNDQDHDKHFHAKNDSGETVEVMPTPESVRIKHDKQPVDAPVVGQTRVYPASYGTGNLIDHGGPQMSNAAFQAIYWNSAVAGATATSTLNGVHYATVQDQMHAFVNGFSSPSNWSNLPTDDYAVVQQYGSRNPIASSLFSYPDLVDGKASQASITDAAIQNYLATLFAGTLTPSSQILYGVYFPPGQKVTFPGGDASCVTFCGYHGYFTYAGVNIKYAVFPYLNCSACTLTGKTVADMLTVVTSHEIREAVTDPNLNAWYDRRGYEADDKCAWHNLYQMTTGGFWVQPEYSNGGTVTRSGFKATYPGPGCVVPNR